MGFFESFGNLFHGLVDEIACKRFEQLAAEVEIKAERLPIHHGNGHFLDSDERLVGKGYLGPFGNIQEPYLQADIFLDPLLPRLLLEFDPAGNPLAGCPKSSPPREVSPAGSQDLLDFLP